MDVVCWSFLCLNGYSCALRVVAVQHGRDAGTDDVTDAGWPARTVGWRFHGLRHGRPQRQRLPLLHGPVGKEKALGPLSDLVNVDWHALWISFFQGYGDSSMGYGDPGMHQVNSPWDLANTQGQSISGWSRTFFFKRFIIFYHSSYICIDRSCFLSHEKANTTHLHQNHIPIWMSPLFFLFAFVCRWWSTNILSLFLTAQCNTHFISSLFVFSFSLMP